LETISLNRRSEACDPAMLNYAGEAGKAGFGDGNTAAFTAGGAAKITRAVR